MILFENQALDTLKEVTKTEFTGDVDRFKAQLCITSSCTAKLLSRAYEVRGDSETRSSLAGTDDPRAGPINPGPANASYYA
jgi:hypothetical protein